MKNKLSRYAYNRNSNYIIEEGKDIYTKTKGNWKKKIFNNNNPILLELACGNGEYTVFRSINEPNKNFIGIDIKGARLWKGANLLDSKDIKNALFLRIQIEQINHFFDDGEVDEILISFPDPRPKKGDIKKRLTNISFLNMYYDILKDKSLLMLKTDDINFFDFTINQINNSMFVLLDYTRDLYNSNNFKSHKEIKTKYETKFLSEGRNINFLRCLR